MGIYYGRGDPTSPFAVGDGLRPMSGLPASTRDPRFVSHRASGLTNDSASGESSGATTRRFSAVEKEQQTGIRSFAGTRPHNQRV